jgi:hypothetical protein
VPPPALVTVTSLPQMLQRYFSPTSFTAICVLLYSIFARGLIHCCHHASGSGYKGEQLIHFALLDPLILTNMPAPRQNPYRKLPTKSPSSYTKRLCWDCLYLYLVSHWPHPRAYLLQGKVNRGGRFR